MPKRPQNEEMGDFFKSDPQLVFIIISFEVKSYCNFGGHFGHCEASVVSSGPMASKGPKWTPPSAPSKVPLDAERAKELKIKQTHQGN